jgi:hypothetical protein
MSGTSGPMSVNMYAGEIDEFEPQAVKGWGKKINFVNAEPELIKQIESRFEEYADGGMMNEPKYDSAGFSREDDKRIKIYSGNKGKLNEIFNEYKNQKNELRANEVFDNEKMKGKSVFLFVNDDFYDQYVQDADEEAYSDENFGFAKGGYMAKGGKVGVKEYKIYPMKPTGVKGMITDDYDNMETFVGTEDEAVARAKEIANSNPNFVRVEVKLRLKTKTNTIGIVDGQNNQYAKGGKLVGKQKNLDVNKNGKLDAEDFKMLRKEKMAKGGKLASKAKYIPKYQIEEVEVDINGKEKEIDGADLLDGLYVKKAAVMTKKAAPKKAKGGEVKAKSNRGGNVKEIVKLAKEIRKDGEKWTDCVKRASAEIKKRKM